MKDEHLLNSKFEIRKFEIVTPAWVWERVLDLVYPPRCGGCDRRGSWLCAECAASIKPPPEMGHSIMGVRALVCVGEFEGPLREAVHHLKYENDTPLAEPLARLMYAALQSGPCWPEIEAERPTIIAVPLHRDRQRERGYNQAQLLANALSRLTGWETATRLVRTRHTHSQVGLSAEERATNVQDAFEWVRGEVPGAVLLVDDVFTTGATLGECVGVLRLAGARRIYVATVARAPGDQ